MQRFPWMTLPPIKVGLRPSLSSPLTSPSSALAQLLATATVLQKKGRWTWKMFLNIIQKSKTDIHSFSDLLQNWYLKILPATDNVGTCWWIQYIIYTKIKICIYCSPRLLQRSGYPHLRPKALAPKLHWSSRNLNESKWKTNLWVALGRCTNSDISLYIYETNVTSKIKCATLFPSAITLLAGLYIIYLVYWEPLMISLTMGSSWDAYPTYAIRYQQPAG